ncbi:MAG: CoA-binding protein [Candidatus Dormiibacterota bacterium]
MANPREILEYARTIAVVGASAYPEKAAHSVPRRMLRAGYKIIPVNPNSPVVLGMEAYPDLASVPDVIDLVDVFRPSAEAADVARQAVAVGARAIWLQQGIVSAEARRIAEAAGMDYVEDRCLAVEYALSGLGRPPA